MDETQQTCPSDASATATRKRRSSILKSQRPPRTPFSELEFHVATPTDTAKSRRVSFSKRTGVAEFITNEATTTWKNFYEEHNKSLELSGNDSGAHAPKPTISHLGNRLFDQQFQEVEVMDFVTSLDNHSIRNINTSMNKDNFTQQLASLECTAGEKSLLNPQANLEMSAFTDCKSNVFGDDFAIPTMGEMSGRIDVNFSAVQAIGSNDFTNDLVQIQEDFLNAKNHVVSCGPFNNRESLSEYLEIDLNSTRVVMGNDEYDMSITDTIQSPKVQDVSKSNSIKLDNKPVFDKDWVADKENIAVFDSCSAPVKSGPERRKTIVYEDDTGNISITQALPVNIILPESKPSEKRNTIVYDSDSADISVTQAVPINIMIVNKDKEKRKTIIYENGTGDISVTQAIPSNIVIPETVIRDKEKRKTIIFENDTGDISVTQAIPSNIVIPETVIRDKEKRKTIIFENDTGDISVTQAIPSNIVIPETVIRDKEKRKTIIFENDTGDISVTQAIPSNIVIPETVIRDKEKRKTIIFDNDTGDISVTQAIPSNMIVPEKIIKQEEKRKTIIFENDTGDISVTQAIPSNIVIPETVIRDKEKRKTIIFENDTGDISVTQAIPSNIVISETVFRDKEKRKTIIFENDTGNISVTQVIPSNIIVPEKTIKHEEKRKTIIYENDTGNISVTQAIPSNIIVPEKAIKYKEKRRTIIYENDTGNISVTQAIPSNIIVPDKIIKVAEKRKTIIYDNNTGNISVAQAMSSHLMSPDKNKSIIAEDDFGNISITQAIPIVKSISSNISQCSHKSIITDEILLNESQVGNDKHKTIIYGDESLEISGFDNNMSITKPIDTKHLFSETGKEPPQNLFNEIKNKSCNDTASTRQDVLVYQASASYKGKDPENGPLPKETQSVESLKLEVKDSISNTFTDWESKESCLKVDDNHTHLNKLENSNNIDESINRQETGSKNTVGEINRKSLHVLDDTLTQINPFTQKRKTIVYDNDMGNLSITQAIPVNIILPTQNKHHEKRKTIIYDTDSTDISVTQAVPVGVLLDNKDSEQHKSIVFENKADISATQVLPTNIVANKVDIIAQPEHEIEDISFTQVIPQAKIISNIDMTGDNKTVVMDEQDSEMPDIGQMVFNINESKNMSRNNSSNIPITHPNNTIPLYSEDLHKSIYEVLEISKNDVNKSEVSKNNTRDLLIYQAEFAQDLITKSSSKYEQPQKRDSSDDSFLRKKPSMSFTKTENNESYMEVNKNLQMSQPRLLALESDERPEIHNICQENEIINEVVPLNSTSTKPVEKRRQSVIDDLLDMSESSLGATLDKKYAAKEKVTDNGMRMEAFDDITIKDIKAIRQSEEPLALEYKEEKKVNMSFEVLKKLKTKLTDIQNISFKHRQREKERKSDVENNTSLDKNKSMVEDNLDTNKTKMVEDNLDTNKTKMVEDNLDTKKTKNFKDANDTNELLEMLSDLTDKSRISDVEPAKESVSRRTSPNNEPRRLSVAPNRLSIVLSREDLLNNISMAHAALQKCMEIDESIADTSITPTDENSPPKPSRVSNEVVKTLHFEDESVSETSVKSEVQLSPLKKSALENVSVTTENKAKVIPAYLGDVSDNLKSLMNDLTKPNADVVPFESIDKGQTIQKNPSTCSTQIQANLITSSQIDVNVDDSNSASTSSYNLGNVSIPSFCTDTKSLKSSLKSSKAEKSEGPKPNVICPKLASPSSMASDRVLIFDQNNPLNNVLLAPTDFSDAHRYRPDLAAISANGSESDGLEKISASNTDNFDGKLMQYNVESVLISRSLAVADSSINNTSRSTSVDESVRVRELKVTTVNTLIAMKQNKELLETNSSLTLVDDAVANNYNVELDNESESSPLTLSHSKLNSPIKLIYQNDENENDRENHSDSTATNENDKVNTENKAKKRNYSPSKKDQSKEYGSTNNDNTPKQISKMQKLSNSPYQPEKAQKDNVDDSVKMDVDTSYSAENSSSPTKKVSPRKSKGGDITVQQLITEYDFEGKVDQEALSKHIIRAFSQSESSSVPSITDVEIKNLEVVSSFTSSKNQMEMRDACSVTTTDTKSSVKSNRSDWKVEVKENQSVAVSECDSSVNVVAKIDMLPFMGSHECEWEPSGSDTWSFRLLHARLRLSVRLAHRHDNATRTRVRADTPVLAVALDTVPTDKKNTVASFCVNLAAETMRQYIGRGCSKAGEVPVLLRRCAAAARVAARWGRAMHEARLHLAYALRDDGTLALKGRAMHEARLHLAYALRDDGTLALKVANIPLRSVWEVTMRLELVTESQSAPWPRARDVTVTKIVSDVKVTQEEVEKLLANVPRDWGHAPRTIWKIFRYLKNKTRDAELLGLS